MQAVRRVVCIRPEELVRCATLRPISYLLRPHVGHYCVLTACLLCTRYVHQFQPSRPSAAPLLALVLP